MTTPENICKCFLIYTKLGVLISHSNMYELAQFARYKGNLLN